MNREGRSKWTNRGLPHDQEQGKVQEKEGSGFGVRGSLMSIDHKRGQDFGKGKT